MTSGSNPSPCNTYWRGGDITLNKNGEKIATISSGFTDETICLPYESVDVESDKFQLAATNNDGVSTCCSTE